MLVETAYVTEIAGFNVELLKLASDKDADRYVFSNCIWSVGSPFDSLKAIQHPEYKEYFGGTIEQAEAFGYIEGDQGSIREVKDNVRLQIRKWLTDLGYNG